MQTFLPYPDFHQSLLCLDKKRLGKQRVEAYQIIQILKHRTNSTAWINHPAVKMWDGYIDALIAYYNESLKCWEIKGGRNIKLKPLECNTNYLLPPWFGDHNFHNSHKSNLIRKDYSFYSKYNWIVPNNLEYVWPK